MELSPSSSESFDSSYDSDKKNGKETKKKGSYPLRVPLPADALHGSEPRKEGKAAERIDGILPIFPKREQAQKPVDKPPAAELPANAVHQQAERAKPQAHLALEDLKDELWKDFDAAPPAPADTAADRRAAASSAPVSIEALERAYAVPAAELPASHPEAREDDDDDESKEKDGDSDNDYTFFIEKASKKEAKQPPTIERVPQTSEHTVTPSLEPDVWHESRTLHLNESESTAEAAAEPPAETATAEIASESSMSLPTAEAMAAEIAATEPDMSSFDPLERAYAMPAAELPASHPEVASPLPPMTEREQFQDIMQRAEFTPDFVGQTSGPVNVTEAAHTAPPEKYIVNLEQSEPEPVDPRLQSSASARAGMGAAAPLTAAANMYPFRGAAPNQYYAAGYAAEGVVAAGMAGAAAGAAMAAGRSREAQQASNAPQFESPVRQPEQATSITNEQRTVVQYPEQFGQASATVPRTEVQPNQAAAQQPEHITAVPLAPSEALQEQQSAEPRTHTVESAWHRVQVENGTNRIVEGQPEGRALLEEKRAESAPPPPPTDGQDDRAQRPENDALAAGSMYHQLLPGSGAPMIGSGQIGMEHELGSGQVDEYHRLQAPRSPVVTALTSPLLWVGIVVLLLAFFASAFL